MKMHQTAHLKVFKKNCLPVPSASGRVTLHSSRPPSLNFQVWRTLPVILFIMDMYTYDMPIYFNINTTYMFKNKGVFRQYIYIIRF